MSITLEISDLYYTIKSMLWTSIFKVFILTAMLQK